jgi:hypothetical protein
MDWRCGVRPAASTLGFGGKPCRPTALSLSWIRDAPNENAGAAGTMLNREQERTINFDFD